MMDESDRAFIAWWAIHIIQFPQDDNAMKKRDALIAFRVGWEGSKEAELDGISQYISEREKLLEIWKESQHG